MTGCERNTSNTDTMSTKAKAVVIKKDSVVENNPAGDLLTSSFSPEALISQAITANLPVETLERLLAMRKDLKAEYAKQRYDEDMASLQSDIPIIVKTKAVKTKSGATAYRYAPLESIVQQTKGLISQHGFSYSTRTYTLEGKVSATVIVKHKEGHTEEYNVEVPLGTKTDIMSASQVVAAALTFAKRYAFNNAFGILTGDEDTDATPESMGETREPAAARAGNYPPRAAYVPPTAPPTPPPAQNPPVPFNGRVKVLEITDVRIPRNDGDRIVIKTASYTLLLPEQLIDYVVIGWQFDVVGTLITNAAGKQAVDVDTVEPVEFVRETPPPAPEIEDETQGWS